MGLPLLRGRSRRALPLRSERRQRQGLSAGSGQAKELREYINAIRDAIDPALPLGFGKIPYGPLQVMHLEADITDLQLDTGFVPATPFEEGIRATIEWMKGELHA